MLYWQPTILTGRHPARRHFREGTLFMPVLDRTQLFNLVQRLTPDERKILVSLREKGPGLPLEVAVRILKMPEEVSAPLQHLAELELVQSDSYSNSAFGGNLVRLTELGSQVATFLADRSVQRELAAMETAAAAAAASPKALEEDPRERELKLLLELAELAKQNGDLAKAATWTEQALEVQRALTRSVP